ncbi:ParB/RepB/Spo0J family partition protein [Palleronia caenipelagi]|nr:ParB/RepB/Spo0J family partition protein [Palleronia caenipelagi]
MTLSVRTMTKSADLTPMEIALKTLDLHPLNARAGAPETYEDADIAVLAASIATLGLLNPIIVQKTGKSWGVIAGGRRLAALRMLADDKSAKGWTHTSKISCRAIPENVAGATAITVAENVTQKPMNPIDEFEAFARMMEEGGHDADSIAKMFGVERRRVVERLRYGRIHPEIRAAARAQDITLDVMKAYAEHPDTEVQKAVFDDLKDQYVSAYMVRNKLTERGVKIGDPIGQLVIEAYRAEDGEIAADLIEEDSVLTDQELVESLVIGHLQTAAEAERVRLGFAWAEGRRTVAYEDLRPYGRVYPAQIDRDEAGPRAGEIADRMAEIEEIEEMFDGTEGDLDALEAEWQQLEAEYEDLVSRYSDEDLALGGVIATWERGQIKLIAGLVRPEDLPGAAEKTASGAGEAEPLAPDAPQPLGYSQSLTDDLKSERSQVIGAALAGAPDIAQDLLLFKIIADLMGRTARVSYAMGISGTVAGRPHAKAEGIDPRPGETLEALRAGLDLSWWDADTPSPMSERFDRFRALDAGMKAQIAAVALAEAIQPSRLGRGEELLAHVARQVIPDLRAVWRPTGEAFFGRLKKSDLLGLLERDLGQPEEAQRFASSKKGEIVDYLDKLFAAPFATLTPEQRAAVESWCPDAMRLPEADDGQRTDLTGLEDDAETGDVSFEENIPFGEPDDTTDEPQEEAEIEMV